MLRRDAFGEIFCSPFPSFFIAFSLSLHFRCTPALPSLAMAPVKAYVSTSGGIKLPGTNGLRKQFEGESLSDSVMSKSERPKINYDKCKLIVTVGAVSYTHLRAHETREESPRDQRGSRMPSSA